MGGFLREMKRRDRHGRPYSYWVAVKSYRDKRSGKVRHQVLQTFGRLSPAEVENLRVLRQLKELGKDVLVTTWEKIQVGASYEYLTIQVLHRLFRVWEIEQVFAGEKEVWVNWGDLVEILTLNRAVWPNSDYRVSSWYQTTVLPQLLNIPPALINPTRIYRCLDQVYPKEERLQLHLADKITGLGYDTVSLIFYDLTSSYFEGYGCSLAQFGLSRDHRKDRPQLLLALCVTKEGFPFYWRVLPGNIHDSQTVQETVGVLKKKFQVGKVCVVMDKGMVTKDNLKQLQLEDLYYLVTIPRPTFRNLTSFPGTLLGKIGRHLEIEATKETPDYQPVLNQFPYFTYHSPRAYFHQLEEKEKGVRYVLCFNPEKFVEERKQRTKKMAELENYFSTWNERLSRAQTTRTKSFIEKEVCAYLKKRKAVHLFLWKVQRTKKIVRRQPPAITLYRLWWRPNRKKLARLQLTDGLYCLKTNLPEQIPPATLVSSYRQRRKVEKAFHYLKAFVEIRPLYHRKEQRVQAHVTICILAYLLQVTVEYLLKKAGQPLSFPEFIEQLVTRRAVELEIRSLKKKQLKLPAIPREIAPLIQAVTPDLFTPAKDGLTNIRKSIL